MSPLARARDFAHSIILLSGWRAHALSFAVGAVSALGQAPFHFFPLMWVTFPVLVLLLDGATPDPEKRGLTFLSPAFWRGWWFGFGYFIAGIWWIGSAFLVDAEEFAWLLPIAVVGLPAFLAIFYGLATRIARMFWHDGWYRIVSLAASFALMEWLRGTVLTGFPWNSAGYLLAANDVLSQGVSITGLYTYGFVAVLVFSAPVLLSDDTDASVTSQKADRRFMTGCAALFAILCLFGFVRLEMSEDTTVAGVSLRVIQPAIDQKDKFKPGNETVIFDRYLEMSRRNKSPDNLGLLSTTHLIWPESAFPFILADAPGALTAIGNLLPPGTILLTGAARTDPLLPGERSPKVYNSIYVIDHEGQIKSSYDKVHLVPFGEYLPFQAILENWGLRQLTQIRGGFTAGTRRQAMTTPAAPPFLPLICYEIIFPGQVFFNNDALSAQWILNVTNDAWFGVTSGPYQHLHQAKIRAIEEGKPVVRAANTGISAVIDAKGRVIHRLPLGEAGIIDSLLPSQVVLLFPTSKKILSFWVILGIAFVMVGHRSLKINA
ncbi:MAG: apolipoprotein N-acyltransferase [Pseudomonadota bacterium]